MTSDFFFIQKYYFFQIIFFLLLLILLFLSYKRDNYRVTNVLTISFAFFTVFYFGFRNTEVGVDTYRYSQIFEIYQNSSNFFIRKDLFYDLLNFLISKIGDFELLLFFNAFLYIFAALYCLNKIFDSNYILPFFLFLITPYFINHGINVMRSGIAGSIFLLGLGIYYQKGKSWKWLIIFLTSILFHISFIIPLISFYIVKIYSRTKVIFILWLFCIIMSLLNLNILSSFISLGGDIIERSEFYLEVSDEQNYWINFFIFGFFPVLFAVYNCLIIGYKDKFYTSFLNMYMLSHIPYILLINSEFASRIGYLAEFMMPILVVYPLMVDPIVKIRFLNFKLAILFFLIFLIKAYKILVL